MMIELRDYQKKAIQAFQSHNNRGILDMATGTGKTFTSIACAEANFQMVKHQVLIILVPFIHLIPQWQENLTATGVHVDVKIAGNKTNWMQKLQDQIWEYNHGLRDRLVIIGSYVSTNKWEFNNLIKLLKRTEDVFLIADECHYLGSRSSINIISVYSSFGSVLGLSATPERWWDEEGTNRIFNLFGGIIYEFSLAQAIDRGFLTPYNYYPIPVYLTIEENEEYITLTKSIGKIYGQLLKNDDDSIREKYEYLLRKRTRVIQQAANKEIELQKVFNKNNDKYNLLYCPDGQIDKYTQLIGNKLNQSVVKFDSGLRLKKRTQILNKFELGEIKTLAAMKCLDEGVDVPQTRQAYFLASTTNPRQFIQRRGRILRNSAGKTQANIYDFIVLPDVNEIDFDTAKVMVKREIPRFHEFCQYAKNEFEARNIVGPILSKFDLDSYMDKSAIDIYNENIQNEEK
ncbi:DEAD/DEAH box helicase family protein [Latilactobacillus curvatus]|uniref:DEAD/DEAH box helicase family protein n=1 Tax=Latilactobacillus curvatus TaxID=28038 RepID=UPI00217F0A26|nr:DEAD/DEAH box helicase family protein [Latilactobacillus curvatus]MCS6143124.1 DEAD/DEAH box helicase [Latilactobacillus curvatus]MCS8617796.1 DEAD/DEAH box helicase [Latilactobacillus curvatus]